MIDWFWKEKSWMLLIATKNIKIILISKPEALFIYFLNFILTKRMTLMFTLYNLAIFWHYFQRASLYFSQMLKQILFI